MVKTTTTTGSSSSSNHHPQQIFLVDIGSRKKGEFERRTAIFEGAFRAWSYLGRLDPADLHKTVAELDPLDHHHPRSAAGRRDSSSSIIKTEYPGENLPRDGLAHPFVQAILSPWLGGQADANVRQRGLDSLRTWWQHRKPRMSRTAVQALSRKMAPVVDGYTRLFFRFAHCLVVHEQATPPPTLQAKMKELQQRQKQQQQQQQPPGPAANDITSSGRKEENSPDAVHADVANPNLTPLEKLHMVQQQRIRESSSLSSTAAPPRNAAVLVNLREKCVPGPIDFLPQVVESIARHHRAMASAAVRDNKTPEALVVRSSSVVGGSGPTISTTDAQNQEYEPDSTTPVVYCSTSGDAMIALTVDGIVCAHCVKIVETVLRGCSNGTNGTSNNKSPIDGLVDAVADHRDIISTVLVKIDQPRHAPRIAHEAVRNLRLVGYEAFAKTMSSTTRVVKSTAEERAASTESEVLVATAFAACSTTCTTTTSEPPFTFDWTVPCTCPEHGTFLLRDDCPRHSQMHHALILDAFAAREGQVHDYLMRMEATADGTAGRPGCHGHQPIILPNTNAAPIQPLLMEAELSSVLVPPARNKPVLEAFDATQHHQQQGQHIPQPPPLPLERPTRICSRDISLSLYSIGSNKSNSRLRESIPGRATTRDDNRDDAVGRRQSSRRQSTLTFGSSMSGLFDLDWENLDDDIDLDA